MNKWLCGIILIILIGILVTLIWQDSNNDLSIEVKTKSLQFTIDSINKTYNERYANFKTTSDSLQRVASTIDREVMYIKVIKKESSNHYLDTSTNITVANMFIAKQIKLYREGNLLSR